MRQRAGQSVLEVMKVAGHTSAQATARYTITDHGRENAVLEKVFEMFDDPVHKQTKGKTQ